MQFLFVHCVYNLQVSTMVMQMPLHLSMSTAAQESLYFFPTQPILEYELVLQCNSVLFFTLLLNLNVLVDFGFILSRLF